MLNYKEFNTEIKNYKNVFSGKVFVHCLLGVSRSATCVLAYLMIKKNMLAVDALRLVRRHRDVRPNNGFLGQLAQLDNHLRRQRQSH